MQAQLLILNDCSFNHGKVSIITALILAELECFTQG